MKDGSTVYALAGLASKTESSIRNVRDAHLLQPVATRQVDKDVEKCFYMCVVSQPPRIYPMARVVACSDIYETKRRDKAETDDAKANEDVFRDRMANHGLAQRGEGLEGGWGTVGMKVVRRKRRLFCCSFRSLRASDGGACHT